MEFTKENYLKMDMKLYSFNGFLDVKGYLEEIKKEQKDNTMDFIKSYIKEKEALVSKKELDELAECFNFDEYDEIYDLVNDSLEMLENSIYNKENLDLKKLHNNLLRLKELI